jgi:hypothetical protein
MKTFKIITTTLIVVFVLTQFSLYVRERQMFEQIQMNSEVWDFIDYKLEKNLENASTQAEADSIAIDYSSSYKPLERELDSLTTVYINSNTPIGFMRNFFDFILCNEKPKFLEKLENAR